MAELAKSNLFTTLIIIVIVIIFFYLIYKFYLKDKKNNSVLLKGVHPINSMGQSIIYNPYNKADKNSVWSDNQNITGISSLEDYKKTVMCQHDGDLAKYTLCFWLRINSMPDNTTTPTVKHILHIGDLVNINKFTGDTSICQPGIWLDTWTNRLLIRFYTLGREKKMIKMIQVSNADFNSLIGINGTTNCYKPTGGGSCNTCKGGGITGKCKCNTCFNKFTVHSLDPTSNLQLQCSNLCENNRLCTMSQTSGSDCQLYTNSGLDECNPSPGNVGKFSQALYKHASVISKCGDQSALSNPIHKKINIMNVQAVQSESDNSLHHTGVTSDDISTTISGSHKKDPMSCKYMNQWPSTPHNGYLTSIRYHTDNNSWTAPFQDGALKDWVSASDNYLSMNPYYNYRILTCQDEGMDIENVPYQRWFHLTIATQPGAAATGGISEVYINGKLLKSKVYQKQSPPVYSNPSSLALRSRNPQKPADKGTLKSTQTGTTKNTALSITTSTIIEYFGNRNLFIGLNSITDATNVLALNQTTIPGRSGAGGFEGLIADIHYFCRILSPGELAQLYKNGPVLSGWNRFLDKLKNMKGWISIGIQVGDGPMHSTMIGKSNYGKSAKPAPAKIIQQAD